MKILFILQTFSRKGAGIMEAPKGLALALAKDPNLSVSALALDDECTDEQLEEWKHINLYRRKNNMGGFSIGMESVLNEIKPAVIHIHGLWLGIGYQAAFWAIKNNVPYVISPHGMMDKWAWKKSRIKKAIASLFFQKKVLSRANKLHALNKEEAFSINNLTRLKNIFIQPNGINISDYSNATKKSRAFKKLLYLGRLDQKKSVLELIKVWKLLIAKSDRFAWKLEIAGSGNKDYEKIIRHEARTIPDKYITFLGHVSGKIKFDCFRNADAFILPSKSEGLPVVILEAWAASLPVAMTKECNLNEALKLRLAFEVYSDINDLENSLAAFLSLGEHELKKMGTAANLHVDEYYSWKNIAEAFSSLYSEIT